MYNSSQNHSSWLGYGQLGNFYTKLEKYTNYYIIIIAVMKVCIVLLHL